MTEADGNGLIVIGFLHRADSIAPQFRRCLSNVVRRDMARYRLIVDEFDRESSANIAQARCNLVRDFLAHPDKPEWLWMVDSDMTFDRDILDRLIASANEHGPLMGGLCFMVRPVKVNGVDAFNGCLAAPLELAPTLYMLGADGKMLHLRGYPQDTVIQVHSTGAACLLIHRSVVADPRWMEDKHPLPWFRESVLKGQPCSEDHFFCVRAGSFGYPVHVDTGARTGHVKTFIADEDLFMEHHRTRTVPLPALRRVAVIVPVLGRPERAGPFMAAMRATTGLATVYAVANDQSDADAWRAAGAETMLCDESGFAPKVNYAYRHTSEDLLLLAGDDIRPHPGWLDHAEAASAGNGALVVGTNDLGGHASQIPGGFSPHPLIARRYIDEQGASWDGPGVVCHEGYRHNFVDNEIVVAAKQRGVWVYAPASIVEHLHPVWGKAEVDATYRKGQSNFDRDERLWKRRFEEHAA